MVLACFESPGPRDVLSCQMVRACFLCPWCPQRAAAEEEIDQYVSEAMPLGTPLECGAATVMGMLASRHLGTLADRVRVSGIPSTPACPKHWIVPSKCIALALSNRTSINGPLFRTN